MRNQLDTIGFGKPYRLLVGQCAKLIYRFPFTERAFVAHCRFWWKKPIVGRISRSVAYRYMTLLSDGGKPYRTMTIAGVDVKANVTDFAYSGVYFCGDDYERELTRYLSTHLKPGHVFVDIGANSGYFTILAARFVGSSGRVFAFEPNPPVCRALERHVEINGVGDRTRVFEVALSDLASDEASLFVTPAHSGFATLAEGSGLAPDYLGKPVTVAVRSRTFDEWRHENHLDHVHVMKIDVEGFEERVLAGMMQTLRAHRIARLACETSWDGRAHRLLTSLGYKPTILESVGPVSNIAYELP